MDLCPICRRPLPEGPAANEHHLVPKTFGGREKIRLHRICHSKIHSLFTERELLKRYNTPEAITAHPEMRKFIRWVGKQPPDFYKPNRRTRAMKRRR